MLKINCTKKPISLPHENQPAELLKKSNQRCGDSFITLVLVRIILHLQENNKINPF